jgi:hypothetical protein
MSCLLWFGVLSSVFPSSRWFLIFVVCFLREIFDELLETEKTSQALSMEVGRAARQAS